jgi:hypothetical protein
MAWVTHSLGFAVAASAAVAAGSPPAPAQSPAAQTQEPSRAPARPADDVDPSRDRRREPQGVTAHSLFLTDQAVADRSKAPFVVESWLSGVEVRCIGCRGAETTGVRPESANANAAWALQGKWRRRTPLGVVSTGFVGVRNYALPLATAIPPGGDIDPGALGSVGSSAFLPGSQWSLTAGVEKTLATRGGGASFGVTADVLVPVTNQPGSGGDPRNTVLSSRTIRVGGIVRW